MVRIITSKMCNPDTICGWFSLDKARKELHDVDMDKLWNVWGVIISCPGCKKNPICKHMSKNFEELKWSYQRNDGSFTLDDVMWGRGALEDWKKTLAESPLTSACSLVASN